MTIVLFGRRLDGRLMMGGPTGPEPTVLSGGGIIGGPTGPPPTWPLLPGGVGMGGGVVAPEGREAVCA